MAHGARLSGHACLIVGGTGGIGFATARRFLEEGARVVITGHEPDLIHAAQTTLEPLGPVRALVVDVRDPESVERLFTEALAWFGGRLDVLLHVAGISGRRYGDGPLDACTVDGWDAVMDVNARGAFLTNRAAVGQMRGQPLGPQGLRGTIVNVGSVLALAPSPEMFGTIAYAASKGAIQSLTLSAAAHYARERIRFHLLVPGLIDTPMSQRAVTDPAIRAYLETKQPIAGGPGRPEDCAEAALFLCEPASRFMTGIVLPVDGGWRISEGRTP